MRDRRAVLMYGGAVVLVQAALMASVWISAPHNGGDNAGYVALAHSLLGGQGYVEAWDPARPLHTKYPPVFPALLALAVAVGARTWTALKLVPAAFTTAAVFFAYLWAVARRGPLFGAAVAFLVALSPGLLWYSHWVLSDVPFVAFTFLALWAFERAYPPASSLAAGSFAASSFAAGSPRAGPSPDAPADGAGRPGAWLALGVASAVLAYFTRSAGLPLLVAVGAWLVLRRRWKALAGFALAAGVPAWAWWARGKGGGADYVGEFWMVDPYTPELGTVGAAGLAARALDNAGLYATRHVPEGLLGVGGTAGVVLGLALLGLAFAGWGMRLLPAGKGGPAPSGKARSTEAGEERAVAGPFPGLHVAELFLPLYAGLILLWPQVWSGDRFALPLFPLLLFYAGDAVVGLARRAGDRWVAGVAVAAVLVAAVPAGVAWSEARRGARACHDVLRSVGSGPYACYGPAWDEFVEAARWSGANLPAGSAVLSRKPRIFYVMGGTPSRTYPFTEDPAEFVRLADEAGARYVLLDLLGRQGLRYVGGAVRAGPEAFCSVRAFGGGAGAASQLLGIVPPELGAGGRIEGGGAPGEGSVRIPPCPADMQPAREVRPPAPTGLEIPLLVGRPPARAGPGG